MEILVKQVTGEGSQVVLLFGLGMIGVAVRDSLIRAEFRRERQINVNWSDCAQRSRAFAEIRRACPRPDSGQARMTMVWSAGGSNFFSSGSQIDQEYESFNETCEFARNLQKVLGTPKFDFHYLSSAGGLFEGQRHVTHESGVSPHRPYGLMKLEQERQLGELAGSEGIAIYRPSSVYGPMVRPRKHGLINHLVAHASNRTTAVLDANIMALRDYVYSGDVGEYIARRISLSGTNEVASPVHFLVSGRNASIYEVVSRIERAMKLKIRYRLDRHFGNSANITFSDSVMPPGWKPSTLEVGIRKYLLKDQPQQRPIAAEGD